MDRLQSFLLSLVIVFPCVSGLIRWKRMRPSYRPFVVLMTIGAITEVLNYVKISVIKGNNDLIINVYSIIEYLLIISQFYFWRFNSRTRRWYPYFGAFCLIIWIVENLIIKDIHHVGLVFRVSSSFFIIILSINEINYIIINESRNLLKNARFLICTGFLIYFLYELLFEGSIYVMGKEQNNTIASKIIELSFYVNAVVNIIYGIAVWFIPKRISLDFTRSEN